MTNGSELRPLDKASADRMDVRESKESWSEYVLVDGAIVRVRNVLVEVWKDRVQRDAEGKPVYHMSFAPIITVTPPPVKSSRRSK